MPCLPACKRRESCRRGKLRIFFGYAAGVGKTFAMLEAAQAERAAGTDIVVGYVEPHGRPETEALLKGLESLPVLTVTYRGAALREFDLDAALGTKATADLGRRAGAHQRAGDAASETLAGR